MKKLTEKERISHQNKVNEEDINLQANVKRESSKNDIDRQELVVSGAPSKKRGRQKGVKYGKYRKSSGKTMTLGSIMGQSINNSEFDSTI